MRCTLNLRLTDELRAFIDDNLGEGTPYLTPNEFVCAVLREKKDWGEAELIRDAILDGYQDAIQGRTVPNHGNLRELMQ